MALGSQKWKACRSSLQRLVSGDLVMDEDSMKSIFIPVTSLKSLIPINVPDYTDFYASMEHAVNVGTMFRGKENALMPNWYRSFPFHPRD